ncbi:MAG: 2-C-methyl-D-erythritol 4-phosphate cytidylyltransferase [Acidimicrobiales bacterium]
MVYAAGAGQRFGGFKQFERIGEARLVDRCLAALAPVCDHLVVVLPAAVVWDGPRVDAAVTGGATNPESVRAGVTAVAADAGVIVLHSPSHPLATPALVRRVVAHLAAGVDGVCAIAPLHDALRRLDDHGNIVEALPKANVVSIQMPLAFRADVLRAALAADTSDSDAQTIVERHGGRIGTIVGEPTNIHVTTRGELAMARHLAPMLDHVD